VFLTLRPAQQGVLRPWSSGAQFGVSVLRSLCLMTAVLRPEPPPWLERQLRRDASLRRLHTALSHALLTLKELLLLSAAFIFATAVLGLMAFGGTAAATEAPVAATGFASFPAALLTSFALFTGANTWQHAMWDAMAATSSGAALFFVSQQLCRLLILSLFTAALVRSFFVEEDLVRAEPVPVAPCAGRATEPCDSPLQARINAPDDSAALHEANVANDPLVSARTLHVVQAFACAVCCFAVLITRLSIAITCRLRLSTSASRS
jgi:hypothetical protein